jgi:hypothetical protein
MQIELSTTPPPMSNLKDPRDPNVMPIDPPCDADVCHRQNGIMALTILVEHHGAATVGRWLRNLAALNGEAL